MGIVVTIQIDSVYAHAGTGQQIFSHSSGCGFTYAGYCQERQLYLAVTDTEFCAVRFTLKNSYGFFVFYFFLIYLFHVYLSNKLNTESNIALVIVKLSLTIFLDACSLEIFSSTSSLSFSKLTKKILKNKIIYVILRSNNAS